MKRTMLTALTLGLTLSTSAAFAQAPGITRYRGVVEQISPAKAEIKTRDGKTISVDLTGAKFIEATKSTVAEITPDSYIGTASVPQKDGTQKALEVSVFDPALRGAGDGSYPWDTPGSTMTNGAVGALKGTSGKTMTVQYKGGEKQIMVPDDVPVVHLAPSEVSKVMVGAHVVAFTTKNDDGSLKGVFLLAGQGSLVPPM